MSDSRHESLTVVYAIVGQSEHFVTDVQVIDGYSTREDIPRILAVKHWSSNKYAEMIDVLAVHPRIDPDRTYYGSLRGWGTFGVLSGEMVRTQLANTDAPDQLTFTEA